MKRVFVVACLAAIVVLASRPAAQSPVAAAFEVVSVKPSNPDAVGQFGGRPCRWSCRPLAGGSQVLAAFGHELAKEVGRRHGSPVEMLHLNRDIFDEATVSVITSLRSGPFEEDEWVGGILSFGEATDGAAIAITNRDERCSMVNLDPDSARPAPEVLKTIVQVRDNKAGVYGTVTRRGRVAAGQRIFFEPATEHRARP